MKRLIRWACASFFLVALICVMGFLRLFIQVDETIQYINWDSSVQILDDGTEKPFVWDSYSNTGSAAGTYRFTGSIPDGLPSGSLTFETADADLSVALNGNEIWHSMTQSIPKANNMSFATVPLPEGTSGTLTITCRISSGASAMFPPLVRFLPANLEIIENTALANRTAFPVGAAAFALLLILGVFLLGISIRKTDWSLIPLMAAVAGLIVYRLCQDEGYYFLSDQIVHLLAQPKTGIAVGGTFIIYLLMNRQRHFWKYIGICAAWSAAVLLICDLISLIGGGSLSRYIHTSLIPELLNGRINNFVYWLSLWLAFATAMISAYSVARTYAAQEVQVQGLQLKNQMITESYHFLENNMDQKSALWHEIRHQLTALDCLYQKQDYDGMEQLLTELLEKQGMQTGTVFTANRTVNIILQDAAAKAEKQDIHFQAQVSVPKDLNMPETDLCCLLLNMLDNALEAAQKVSPPGQRTISIQIRIVNLYLAVKCENTYNGEILRDKKGNLLTTKKDAAFHGFGCQQMIKIAQKYQSTVRFDTADPYVFRVETALRIPDRQSDMA